MGHYWKSEPAQPPFICIIAYIINNRGHVALTGRWKEQSIKKIYILRSPIPYPISVGALIPADQATIRKEATRNGVRGSSDGSIKNPTPGYEKIPIFHSVRLRGICYRCFLSAHKFFFLPLAQEFPQKNVADTLQKLKCEIHEEILQADHPFIISWAPPRNLLGFGYASWMFHIENSGLFIDRYDK